MFKLFRNAVCLVYKYKTKSYCSASGEGCSIYRFRGNKSQINLENMSLTHLAAGSTEPPLVEGEFRLYSMRFCPFAHRIHLVLNAKKVPYNVVYINLVNKPEWYLEKFPAGKVPALLYNGEFLYESLLLADFLNEQFPDSPLYPNDPLQKLKDKLLIDSFGKVTSSFHNAIMKQEFNPEDYKQFLEALRLFEEELIKRKSKFFSGNSPGMVDYMIWPWFERWEAAPLLIPNIKVPYDDYPALIAWKNRLQSDSAIQKHYLTADIHAKHFKLRKDNLNAFDIL